MHPIIFAIFYCLEACHRSCPHLTGGNYTNFVKLRRWDLGATFQCVCFNLFTVRFEAKNQSTIIFQSGRKQWRAMLDWTDRKTSLQRWYLGRGLNKWRKQWCENHLEFLEFLFRQRCEQMKKTVVQKQFGISRVWNNGKYARIGSREYALKWTTAQPTLKWWPRHQVFSNLPIKLAA